MLKYENFSEVKMPYVNSKAMLKLAQTDGYAVPAMNIDNMEMAQAVISTAERLRSPAIIQISLGTSKYGSPGLFSAMIMALASTVSVPISLHFDHGRTFEIVEAAAKAGFSSIMYDGSALRFEENIGVTSKVVEMAKSYGASVEAELGKIGGVEEDISADAQYTDPGEAQEFVLRTGVDSLAIAIGTAHGIYATKPVLDIDRVAKIKELVDVPLVLHGGSGLPDDDIKKCVSLGICKVNFATEMRLSYLDGFTKMMLEKPDAIDPKVYGSAGIATLSEFVAEKMAVCGSARRVM